MVTTVVPAFAQLSLDELKYPRWAAAAAPMMIQIRTITAPMDPTRTAASHGIRHGIRHRAAGGSGRLVDTHRRRNSKRRPSLARMVDVARRGASTHESRERRDDD